MYSNVLLDKPKLRVWNYKTNKNVNTPAEKSFLSGSAVAVSQFIFKYGLPNLNAVQL